MADISAYLCGPLRSLR